MNHLSFPRLNCSEADFTVWVVRRNLVSNLRSPFDVAGESPPQERPPRRRPPPEAGKIWPFYSLEAFYMCQIWNQVYQGQHQVPRFLDGSISTRFLIDLASLYCISIAMVVNLSIHTYIYVSPVCLLFCMSVCLSALRCTRT